MRLWRKKKLLSDEDLWPHEVFIDAENIPGYEKDRLEGVIEKPLSKTPIVVFMVVIAAVFIALLSRAYWLGIVRGEEYFNRSVNNYIRITYIDTPRGVIYDRMGEIIVTNRPETIDDGSTIYKRAIRHGEAYSHLIGYIGRAEDADYISKGYSSVGKGGLELIYNDALRGVPGEYSEEVDALGNVIAVGTKSKPTDGDNITLTINSELQEYLYNTIKDIVDEKSFKGGAAVVFNTRNGEILSLLSYPSFDLNKMSGGLSQGEAEKIFSDPRAPFFNRAISGAYSPGSVIKPYIALAALEEKVISPDKQIFSSGSISLPDPYQEGKFSVFRDWKAHGWVNMERAIKVSSNVYFYTIGGGFEDVAGLGIRKIKRWLHDMGFDTKTGVGLLGERTGFLPDPEWKETARKSNPIWRVGDTYNVSIGQGDISVTPIGIARAVGILATRGKLLQLHLLKGKDYPPQSVLDEISGESFDIVERGMIGVASPGGTAGSLSAIPIKLAAKTGTAEVNNKKRVNSWFTGYVPANDPKLGVVIFLESGPKENKVGATSVAFKMFTWILAQGGIDSIAD